MPDVRLPARLLRTFVRSDERQSLFILLAPDGLIQIVEDSELWEEPHEDREGSCYAYYPTVFPAKRFANLDEALRHARKYFPWIDDSTDAGDGRAAMNRTPEPVGTREG